MLTTIILFILALVFILLCLDLVLNAINGNKDCFMCWGSSNCTDCKFCFRCNNCNNSQFLIYCKNCNKCKKSSYLKNCIECYECESCRDSQFCSDCKYCRHCIKCFFVDNLKKSTGAYSCFRQTKKGYNVSLFTYLNLYFIFSFFPLYILPLLLYPIS